MYRTEGTLSPIRPESADLIEDQWPHLGHTAISTQLAVRASQRTVAKTSSRTPNSAMSEQEATNRNSQRENKS